MFLAQVLWYKYILVLGFRIYFLCFIGFVFSVLARRLAGENISKMTYEYFIVFCVERERHETVTLSVNVLWLFVYLGYFAIVYFITVYLNVSFITVYVFNV